MFCPPASQGDEVIVSHISQHGKTWPYWFRKMGESACLFVWVGALRVCPSEVMSDISQRTQRTWLVTTSIFRLSQRTWLVTTSNFTLSQRTQNMASHSIHLQTLTENRTNHSIHLQTLTEYTENRASHIICLQTLTENMAGQHPPSDSYKEHG